MIPARYAPAMFALIASGLMSFIVTCVATIKALGLGDHTFAGWMGAWSFSWPIAFAVIFFAGPAIRKMVAKMVRAES